MYNGTTPINPVPPNYSGLANDTSARWCSKQTTGYKRGSRYFGTYYSIRDTAGGTISDASKYQNEKTTVAGQLSSLSVYERDAKSKLLGSELGMLSSDRYIGAATGAAIREGLPIAQQDADSDFWLGQGETTWWIEGGALKSQLLRINPTFKPLDATAEEGKRAELYGYIDTAQGALDLIMLFSQTLLLMSIILKKLAGFQGY